MPIANNGGANSVAVAEHTLDADPRRAEAPGPAAHRLHGRPVAHRRPRRAARGTRRRARHSGSSASAPSARRWRGARSPSTWTVKYFDVVRLTEDQEDALGVDFALLPELLRASDIVSLHVPFNDATRKMMGAREFGMMKDTAIFINTCRGPVVDEDALYQALHTRQIAAAGLDVMLEEPPKSDHPLFKLGNGTSRRTRPGPRWRTGRRLSATHSTTCSGSPAARSRCFH